MPTRTDENHQHWVVGIGASAGGLEALSAFVRELPEGFNAAFVIAQHLAPHSKSMMTELLSRQTRLPVVTAQDRMKLESGHLYVIPPNMDASFSGMKIRLTRAGEETRPKPSVDRLLKSLADNFSRRAVGIILSGTGTDGAEGMRAIKEAGGIILSQDNVTAKYDGMPRAAQDINLMDEVLPADQLGKRLTEILADHGLASEPGTAGAEDELDQVLDYLKKQTQQDFTRYKRGTIGRRVEKRVVLLSLNSMQEYLERLRTDPLEVRALAQEMLVSVTSFFRDPEAFQSLEPALIELIERRPLDAGEFRVWVAGCATGEEAYSIAILIHEIQRKNGSVFPFKIFATDLDVEALAYARAGVYGDPEMSGLSDTRLAEYFDRREAGYEAKKFLKEYVVFAKQNLIQNPPFVRLDLVTCRNVMIYFDNSLQQRVFNIFQYALRAGGLLFLGKSENAPTAIFENLDRKNKIFRRLNLPSVLVPLVSRQAKEADPIAPLRFKDASEKNASLDSAVHLQLLREYRLRGVVVDEEGAIYHTFGDLTAFLAFPKGLPDFRLVNLLPRSASVELLALIRKTKKDGKPHRSRDYPAGGPGNRMNRFVVRPFEIDPESRKKLYLVSFERLAKPKRKVESTLAKGDESAAEILDLRRELASTKEHLQTLVEELEISNEELQSLNEELSSTNEELQASNEELETTNEELQASNEELVTVNEELSTKQSELKLLNLSLENIQNSLDSPLVVVDGNLSVVSYNRDASKIFNIFTKDLGRRISEVSCQCEIRDFEQQLRTTLLTGRMTETSCENQGQRYQVRIHPNRDEIGRASGAVIIFFDNTDVIQAQEQLKLSDSNIRSIIDGTPALISLKDLMGKYVTVNAAFRNRLGLKESDILGRTDRDLFPKEQANLMRDRDLEMFLRRSSTHHEEMLSSGGEDLTYYTTRFPLQPDSTGAPQIVGTVAVDITPQIRAQADLQMSESRYRAIVEDQAVLVCRHLPHGELTFVNAAFCAFLGGTPKINLARSFYSFLEPSDINKVKQDLAVISQERPVMQVEVQVRSPSSPTQRWVHWIHRGSFDAEGRLVELQAVGFDVTETHHQTRYLLQKETLFTHVLEHTSDYLTVYKIEGEGFVLESYNPSAAKTQPQGTHRLIGQRLEKVNANADTDLLLTKYRECAKNQSVVTFEEEVQSPRGSLYLLTTLVPILGQDYRTERIAALSRDITHLKRVEYALREQKRAADEASRAKSDFLAAMSHELRTPLGVISGMSQLLVRDAATQAQQKYLATIQQSCRNLLSLIEDILDVSKIEAGKLALESQVIDFDQLLDEIEQSFEPAIKLKGLDFVVKRQQQRNIRLLGDQKRIRQVLINLLGNAAKFTEKGSIEMRVSSQKIGNTGSQRVQIEVEDTGVGIPVESFHRIFTRFSQGDSGISRKYGGTGLGLAISKQLVELMGGQIGFESAEGKGSTFWFALDLSAAPEEKDLPPASTASENYDLSEATLLVVDDNFDSLQLMELFLKERVKQLYLAQDPHEAVRIVEKSPVDLVIMDIQMPIMDGMETTRAIRRLDVKRRDLPIIAVTANAMAGDRERFLAAGLTDYISKPVDFDHLYKKIYHWTKQANESNTH